MNKMQKEDCIEAIKNGRTNKIEQLIAEGVNVNVILGDGYVTPLLLAVDTSSLEIVKILLGAGADPNSDWKKFSLMDNAKKVFSHKEMSKKYIPTPLILAICNDNIDICNVLLEAGADPDLKDSDENAPLIHAHDKANEAIVRMLVESKANVNCSNKNGVFPLVLAIQSFDAKVFVDLLIDSGADVKKATNTGDTPLHFAANSGDWKLAKRLIESGANVDWRNKKSQTPLFFAYESVGVIKVLASSGANVNEKDTFGETPMHCMARVGFFKGARALVEAGASVNEKNKKGETPLHVAKVNYNENDIVQYLIDSGANVNEVDSEGRTPAYIAAKENDHGKVSTLENNKGHYGSKQKPSMEEPVKYIQCDVCANTYTEDFFDQHTCA